MRGLRAAVGPTLLLAVVGGALAVGSGAFDATAASAASRAVGIERDVRCPAAGCGDLSVLQSEAPSSIALRDEIQSLVDRGVPTSAILHKVAVQYGTSILLSPPAGGLDTVLWAAPAVGAAAAIAGLAVLGARRRTPAGRSP